MPVTLAEIELQTRELSAEDRARLALSLIESLETGAEEMWKKLGALKLKRVGRRSSKAMPKQFLLLESLPKFAARCGEANPLSF